MRTYSLTIAIPAYNEASSLERVLTSALRAAQKYANEYEVLVVDDGSTDDTGAIAARFARSNSHIRIIRHPGNLGFSGAIKSCYTKSKMELIFLLPADGQIDAMDVGIFLKKIDDADVVVGYRTNNPEPITRKINSFVFHTLYRLLFGVRLKEISTSILWRKSALDHIDITAKPRSALIEPEVVYKAWAAGLRFAHVPIPYYPRTGGKPKGANPLMIIMTLKELLRLWWEMRVRRQGAL